LKLCTTLASSTPCPALQLSSLTALSSSLASQFPSPFAMIPPPPPFNRLASPRNGHRVEPHFAPLRGGGGRPHSAPLISKKPTARTRDCSGPLLAPDHASQPVRPVREQPRPQTSAWFQTQTQNQSESAIILVSTRAGAAEASDFSVVPNTNTESIRIRDSFGKYTCRSSRGLRLHSWAANMQYTRALLAPDHGKSKAARSAHPGDRQLSGKE
jgi:hypothetical protein